MYPEEEWLEWKFKRVPLSWWKDVANQRRYLLWLVQELDHSVAEDKGHDDVSVVKAFERISVSDLKAHYGSTLVEMYHSSMPRILAASFPNHTWQPWLFPTPIEFWHERQNQRRYMEWLGERLGYNSQSDWYEIKLDDFIQHSVPSPSLLRSS